MVRPRAAGGYSARAGPASTPQRVSASPRPSSVVAASPRRSPSVAAASPRRSPSVCASPRRSPSVGSNRPSSQDVPKASVGQQFSARGAAGSYRSGDLCEFWSNSHNDWLPAQVIKADAGGRIIIDLKPNTWLSKDEQSSKIRPRKPAALPRPMSANRLPQVGGSPQLPRPPLHRSPSWGSNDNRAPSPSGRAATPMGMRAPSPRGMATPMTPGGRAMTPKGARAQSPSGRLLPWEAGGRPMTPSRQRTPSSRDSPSRAASPRAGSRPPRVSASPLRAGGAAIAGL